MHAFLRLHCMAGLRAEDWQGEQGPAGLAGPEHYVHCSGSLGLHRRCIRGCAAGCLLTLAALLLGDSSAIPPGLAGPQCALCRVAGCLLTLAPLLLDDSLQGWQVESTAPVEPFPEGYEQLYVLRRMGRGARRGGWWPRLW